MQKSPYEDFFGLRPRDTPDQLVSKIPQFSHAFAATQAALDTALAVTPVAGVYEAPMPWRTAVGLWLRSIESCKATLVLMDLRMFGAAMATMRTALECLFYAGALWKSPELHELWVNWQVVETGKQASALKASSDYTLLTEDNRRTVDAWIAAEKGPDKLDAYRAAKHADLEWLYTLGYRGCSSGGAHATPLSLQTHLEKLEGVVVFNIMPDLTGVTLLLQTVQQCLVSGADLMKQHASGASALQPNPE